VKIARLARTFGAGTPNDEDDMRVASQFARKALAGEDIELHTPGNSIANCCYTADAVRGLLIVLIKGRSGEAYNIANPAASATIREMAEIVAGEAAEGKIKVAINVPEDIQKRGYAPDVGYRLNADKLKALGWAPKYGIAEAYRRMIADWREAAAWESAAAPGSIRAGSRKEGGGSNDENRALQTGAGIGAGVGADRRRVGGER
jgi:nucleoside-diphosphate-sugar epimerase